MIHGLKSSYPAALFGFKHENAILKTSFSVVGYKNINLLFTSLLIHLYGVTYQYNVQFIWKAVAYLYVLYLQLHINWIC